MKWFLDLSTKMKLSICFGVMILIIASVIGVAYVNLKAMQERQSRVFGDAFVKLSLLQEIRGDMDHARAQILELISLSGRGGDVSDLEESIRNGDRKIISKLNEISGLMKDDPAYSADLERMNQLATTFFETRPKMLDEIRSGNTEEARSVSLGSQKRLYDESTDLARKIGNGIRSDTQHLVEASERKTAMYLRILPIGGAFSLLLSALIVIFLNLSLAKPLDEVQEAALRIATGDLSLNLPDTGRQDEVGKLKQAFGRMVQSLQQTAEIAERISRGNLTTSVVPQSEKDVLANAFSGMVHNLRHMMSEIAAGISVLASTSTEILAASAQVASGTSETAASISQTTATVEEVKQTAQLANQKAKVVSENAQKATQVAQVGRITVGEAVDTMNRIRDQMGSVRESTVKLSEQSQAIAEIVETVNDLAEQSNLLAVNAAIEAAKAGESGKGFSVVAQEIRNLSDQSKHATSQVRNILNEIHRGIGETASATDLVVQAVDKGMKQSAETGKSVRSLADTVTEAAQAAIQIAASSQQQLYGLDQVRVAMENIKGASAQNVTGTRQSETAAQNLHVLGQRLKEMVGQYKV